ncbi:hypothetical protein [Saliterribacillus persicus]
MHGLRHTHGSVLLYKKVSIYYVSERLGHGDIETILLEYSHVVRELRVEGEAATTATFENMVVYKMCKMDLKSIVFYLKLKNQKKR